MTTKTHITIEGEAQARLHEMTAQIGAASPQDCIRTALLLLDQILTAKEEGGTLVYRSPSGKETELLVIVT